MSRRFLSLVVVGAVLAPLCLPADPANISLPSPKKEGP